MQKLKIREGRQSDLVWITKMLEQGVEDGHFSKPLKNNSAPLLNAIINKMPITFVGLRSNIDSSKKYNFELLVAEVDADPVSFLIVKSGVDGVELHLGGIKKSAVA